MSTPTPPDLDGPSPARAGLARLRDPLLWTLALGLVWRLAFLFWTGFAIESDESVVGLMARHIGQLRELPVWYYGQEYMGALEAYAAAPWVKLLGAGPVALKLTALGFWLVFAWATAALCREVFGRGSAAFFACAWLALGPLMATLWTLKLRGGFVSTLAIGQLVLLLAFRLGTRGATARGAAALGLLAGLGIWLNLLIAPFLAAAALFLVARREFICRPRAIAVAAAGLVAGSSPFWGYNLLHDWATFRSLFSGDGHLELGSHLRTLFTINVPSLLGVVPPWDYDKTPAWGSPVLAVFAVASLVLLWRAGRGLLGLVLPSRRPTSGAELWVLTALGFVACAAFTRFGGEFEARYAIVLYAFLAPAIGLLLGGLWDRGGRVRVAAGLLAAGLLAGNAASIYGHDRRLPTQPLFYIRDQTLDPLDQTPLYRLLEAEGIDALTTDYWSAYRIIYETDEKVVAAARDWGRYAPYAEWVKRANRRAWLFRDGGLPRRDLGRVVSELTELGVPFRTEEAENYQLVIPEPGLDRRAWRVKSSDGVGGDLAFDGDHGTRWSTGADQRPGQSLEIDMGAVHRAARLAVLFEQGDEPQKLRLEASSDGSTWETVVEASRPPARWKVDLFGRPVRALRLTQLGERRGRWWSVQELYLFEAPEPAAP